MARKKTKQTVTVSNDTTSKGRFDSVETVENVKLPAIINTGNIRHTIENAQELQDAYDFFNEHLFNGKLPHVLITWTAKKSVNGYYHHEKFVGPNGVPVSQIALNPEIAHGRSERETLSTLVHEMVHHWQFEYGEPSRQNGSYHNREWAEKMKTLGLWPIACDGSGKETGQKITHMIGDGGDYAKAYEQYKANGLALNYSAIPDKPKEKKKAPGKVKYTSPDGESNVWGKAGLQIFDEAGKPWIESK